MQILLANKSGTFDVTGLATAVQWSGDYRQCSRTLELSLIASPNDPALPEVDCAVGSAVTMRTGGAEFSGFVVSRTKSTQGGTINLVCYDRGFYLKKIELSRKLTAVLPEDVTRELCAAYSIETGALAATGVRVTRNFPGANLWDIIRTAYVLASEQKKVKYHIGFEGARLCARAKTANGETPVIEGTSVLMDATTTESVENMVNSVLVVDEAGKTVQALRSEENVALYGLMQRVVREDEEGKAQELLDENGFDQKITVNTLGDARFTAGSCVIIREPYTGLAGLFWIDSDAHEWSKGVHKTHLSVTFQAMMDENKAGEEEG